LYSRTSHSQSVAGIQVSLNANLGGIHTYLDPSNSCLSSRQRRRMYCSALSNLTWNILILFATSMPSIRSRATFATDCDVMLKLCLNVITRLTSCRAKHYRDVMYMRLIVGPRSYEYDSMTHFSLPRNTDVELCLSTMIDTASLFRASRFEGETVRTSFNLVSRLSRSHTRIGIATKQILISHVSLSRQPMLIELRSEHWTIDEGTYLSVLRWRFTNTKQRRLVSSMLLDKSRSSGYRRSYTKTRWYAKKRYQDSWILTLNLSYDPASEQVKFCRSNQLQITVMPHPSKKLGVEMIDFMASDRVTRLGYQRESFRYCSLSR
ncbi:hypothetical protein KCU66_g61, partial [Aureobasidium melanogenum]